MAVPRQIEPIGISHQDSLTNHGVRERQEAEAEPAEKLTGQDGHFLTSAAPSLRDELCQMNDQLQRLISTQPIAPPANRELFVANPELGPAFRVMRDLPVVEQLAFLRLLVQQCSVSQIERANQPPTA